MSRAYIHSLPWAAVAASSLALYNGDDTGSSTKRKSLANKDGYYNYYKCYYYIYHFYNCCTTFCLYWKYVFITNICNPFISLYSNSVVSTF